MTLDEMTRIAQIVGQLLLSDMALTSEESEFLDALMNRYALDDEARTAVFSGVNLGDDPAERVAALSVEARRELLEVLRQAADADGVVEPAEARLIAKVQQAVTAAGG